MRICPHDEALNGTSSWLFPLQKIKKRGLIAPRFPVLNCHSEV
jgi:hypothetical protein